MFSVYILRNSKNHLYIGSTNNLEERVSRHNSGQGAEFTKRNKDFKFVYQERYFTLIEARKREKQIKGGDGKRKRI